MDDELEPSDLRLNHDGNDRIEIIGLGLIGSSIALRLHQQGWVVSGTDVRNDRMARALELGIIDHADQDLEASIVLISTPAAAVVEIAKATLEDPHRADVICTDVAGVKSRIVEQLPYPRFVGGHPMAGSEQEGPDGADADLFQGATWVLTPSELTDPSAFRRMRAFVSALGADSLSISAQRHDELVAVVSHLPHLAAANLMAVATEATEERGALLRLAAGGFRDMTRIAAGDPMIWPDVVCDNSEFILGALDALRDKLEETSRIVKRKDRAALIALLDRAKQARRSLPARVPLAEEMLECRLPVPDRPGVLAEVTTVLGELGVNIWDLEIAHSVEGDRGVLVLAISAGESERAREALVARGYHPSLGRLA